MEDLEDVTIIDSSFPENSIKNTTNPVSTELFSDSDLCVAESYDVVSTMEDSIICIDEEETVEYSPLTEDTPLNLSTTSLPVSIPLASNGPESSSALRSSNEDNDFSIVYESITASDEVQIVGDYPNRNAQTKTKHRIPQNPTPSNQSEYHNSSASPTEQINASIDDSILIVKEIPAAQSENQSSVLNRLQQIVADSTEKKKRKIECSVCFEGPDEIAACGENLVSTVCGHIFCSDCIKQAIKCFKHCPQCRKRLTMKQFHVLYV